MSQDQQHQHYIDELPRALLNFQFLEEALKQYLLRCHFMIATAVRPFLAYDVDQAGRLQSLPLGKLVHMFRSCNGNKSLAHRLLHLPERRNYLAHRAYVEIQNIQERGDSIEVALKELESAIAESRECFFLVGKETEELERRFVEFRNRETGGVV